MGAYGWLRPAGKPEPLVAVLPFDNLSPDPQLGYFADGAFHLSSDGRRFGDAGYYRIHAGRDGQRRARYVPALKEHPLVDLPLYQRDVQPLFDELA